jgi:hypothetical protein
MTIETDLTTRAGLLRRGAIGGAVLVGGSALAGSLARTARAGDPNDNVADADVLNYALTLEYLEATFYTQALGGTGTSGVASSPAKFTKKMVSGVKTIKNIGPGAVSSAYARLAAIRDHEVAHVSFIKSALGSAAVPPCSFDFSSAFKSVTTFISTAQVLENTGVKAYDGAIGYVDAAAFLTAGASIATVEARHAAYLNMISAKASPFPAAFDQGLKPSQILALAKPFITAVPDQVAALFTRLP